MSPTNTNYKNNSYVTITQARVNPTPSTAGERWRPPNIIGVGWEQGRVEIDRAFRTLSNSLYSTSDTHQMNPVNGDIATKGSIPPAFCTTFSYTSTASSITWTWPSSGLTFTVYRADGTTVLLRKGSVQVTGLAGGTYNFYPFYDEIVGDVLFLNIPPGTGGGVGGSIAFSTDTPQQRQAQALQHRIPLSAGAMTAATGGGSGTGGGR